MKKILISLASVISVFVLILAFNVLRQLPQIAQGSVQIANEYFSTSTPATAIVTLKPVLLREGYGSLGSVVVLGAAAGSIIFYDATTTDITKRNNVATSTIADLPASLAAGTYTFDVRYNTGLIVEVVGNEPTSTISWR